MPLYELYSNLVGGVFPGRERERERLRARIADAAIGAPTDVPDDLAKKTRELLLKRVEQEQAR